MEVLLESNYKQALYGTAVFTYNYAFLCLLFSKQRPVFFRPNGVFSLLYICNIIVYFYFYMLGIRGDGNERKIIYCG